WRRLALTTASALSAVGRTPLTRAELMDFPPVTINPVGSGRVAYIPCNVFSFFSQTRNPMVRVFLGGVVRALKPAFAINVQAPPTVDVLQRMKDNSVLVHLANRQEGVLSAMNPLGNPSPVGPVLVSAIVPAKPSEVRVLFQEGESQYSIKDNPDGKGFIVTVAVPQVDINCTVVISFS
ncbi:MAG: hypothetical protein ACYC6L_11470, partial [Anaerolineae bacterium]